MKIESLALEITDEGEVFFQGKRCATQRSTRGYNTLRVPLHRFIAQAVHGSPPTQKHVCHHVDGNPRNNRPDNLKWMTQQENMRLRATSRTRVLTPKQVADILSKKPGPRITLRDLAERFGVAIATVEHLRSGRSHKHGWKKTNRGILTASQFKQIMEWKPPVITAAMLARRYHVSDATIFNVWHGMYPVD